MSQLIRIAMIMLAASLWPNAILAQPKPPTSGEPVLLGQFGAWKAYKAMSEGKVVCFALSEPIKALTEPAGRQRDPSYAFVSIRPPDKTKKETVVNEVSLIVGYPQKADHEATASIGPENFALHTLNERAWIKDLTEQAPMVAAMRKGAELVIKSESSRGTKTTDTYSLKGIAQALDKVAEECQKMPSS